MDDIVLGDTQRFAIQYTLDEPYPFIRVRWWIMGVGVGDYSKLIVPEAMCRTLVFLLVTNDPVTGIAYESEASVPEYEELLELGGWSFGESFDDSSFVFYKVIDQDKVCFQCGDDRVNGDGLSHSRITSTCTSMQDFKDIVSAFVEHMIRSGRCDSKFRVPLEDHKHA